MAIGIYGNIGLQRGRQSRACGRAAAAAVLLVGLAASGCAGPGAVDRQQAPIAYARAAIEARQPLLDRETSRLVVRRGEGYRWLATGGLLPGERAVALQGGAAALADSFAGYCRSRFGGTWADRRCRVEGGAAFATLIETVQEPADAPRSTGPDEPLVAVQVVAPTGSADAPGYRQALDDLPLAWPTREVTPSTQP